MSGGHVDASTFRAAIAPTVAAVRDLAEAVLGRHDRPPGVPSEATAEIEAESDFAAHSSWSSPIMDTHTFGGTTLYAAADHARGFAHAIDADPTPVFAHLPVARSVLETCVVSFWLNEPNIEPVERVKRGLCEQLYSAKEQIRLRLEPEEAKERLKRWQEDAARFGWNVSSAGGGKPVVDGVSRPSVPAGIDELMLGEESRIGRTQWSYLSAVTHGTWYGLAQSFVSRDDTGTGIPGTARVAIGTASSADNAQAICVLRCLRKTASARFRLMAWDDDEWMEIARTAERFEHTLIAGAARVAASGRGVTAV